MEYCVSNYSFKIDENAPVLLKLKLPKLIIGPFELGSNFVYDATPNAPHGLEANAPIPFKSSKRIASSVSVKDIWIRGKVEVLPDERKIRYSKKLRLPWTRSTLCTIGATASLPDVEPQGSLRNVLGVVFDFKFDVPRDSLAPRTDRYVLPFDTQIPIPRGIFPLDSVSLKTKGHVEVEDSGSIWDVRTSARVSELAAVVRLYDRNKIKPCAAARRLALLAFGPIATTDDVKAAAAFRTPAPLIASASAPLPAAHVCPAKKEPEIVIIVDEPKQPVPATAAPPPPAPAPFAAKKEARLRDDSSFYELVPVTRDPDVWDHMASKGRIWSRQVHRGSQSAQRQLCAAMGVAHREAKLRLRQARRAGVACGEKCRARVEELHVPEAMAAAWEKASAGGVEIVQKLQAQLQEVTAKRASAK